MYHKFITPTVVLLLALLAVVSAKAQQPSSIYVVERDVAEMREHPCVVPGRISQERTDRIERIVYLDSTMTVIHSDGSQTLYPVANIQRVATRSGGFYSTTSFLPEGYKALFDFDSHYEYPGAEDSCSYVKDESFVPATTVSVTLAGDTIILAGNTAVVCMVGEGSIFTLTATASDVEYRISGTLNDGCLVLEGDHAARVVLDNASITSGDGASLISRVMAPLYVTSTPGSRNDLSGIRADSTLNLSGEGVVRLASDSEGISLLYSAECINISGGVYDLFVSGNDSKGIYACQKLTITAGNYHIITTGASTDQTEECLGEQRTYAILANELVTIDGGKFFIKTFGTKPNPQSQSSGAVGIGSLGNMVFNGGEYYLATFDDPVNTSHTITVNGGRFVTTSLTDDGFNANTLKVTGGEIFAYGPDGGFDTKSSNAFTVSHGSLIGIGPKSSKSKTGSSYQPMLYFKDIAQLQKYVRIVDETGTPLSNPAGDELLIEIPELKTMCIFVTMPQLVRDGTYYLETTDNVTHWQHIDQSATLCK